jgi:hypothetical protein
MPDPIMPDSTLDPNQYFRLRSVFGIPQQMDPGSGNQTLTAPSIVPSMNISSPPPPQSVSLPAPNTSISDSASTTMPGFTDFSDYDVGKRMQELYKPETGAATKFSQAVQAMPKLADYHPSILSRIGGALTAVAGGMAPGRGMDFYHMNPAAIQEGMQVMNAPYIRQMTDWENQIKPLEQSASLERYANVSNRQMAFQTVSDELKNQAEIHKNEKNMADAAVKEQRAQVYELKARGWNFNFKGPTIIASNAQGEVRDTKIPTGVMSELDKMNLGETYKLANIDETGALAEGRARITAGVRQGEQNWQPGDIPDPQDPTKRIGVMYNTKSGEVRRAKLTGEGGVPTAPLGGPLFKAGAETGSNDPNKVTQQTKAMMEGAQMLLPHVGELRAQAKELEKRRLFGPMMSRIRNAASKLGTTGMAVDQLPPEQVEKNLNDFAKVLATDPGFTDDALVGQFTTALGLMASGMGRVHGGARGGGSIQMINYLKSLLSSDSTLDMFGGRLNSVESYLKGYAKGPVSKTSTKLDEVLEGMFPDPSKQ